MNKWYNEKQDDEGIVISSRIRLARNVKQYPFPLRLDDDGAQKLVVEVQKALSKENQVQTTPIQPVVLEDRSNIEKLALFENHAISKNFFQSEKKRELFLRADEKVSVMVNEEDHIRLQTILYGDHMEEAFALANDVDDWIESSVEYAFDKNFGYLTSCPTNVGTGLRASYMIHIPMLSRSTQLQVLMNAIGKFGIILRGVHGEGTEPIGNIFQISNQITLGKSETEIINTLKNITNQMMAHEKALMEHAMEHHALEWKDKIYRAYGILKNARKMGSREALDLLSLIRLGFQMDLLDIEKPKDNIYHIMMNTRSGNLQVQNNCTLNEEERDVARAEYLRTTL